MKYKCTLMSDVILSKTPNSKVHLECLDYIPGNNFLGIVAAQLYDSLDKKAFDVFHSGKVRFGDAHPSLEGKKRGLKVPCSMFYPKLKKASEECYIHHLIPNRNSEEVRKLQLKQCREGFYAFEGDAGIPIKKDKNVAIKSAYDSDKRRSQDEQLFVYESMPKGLVLYFDIEADVDGELAKEISKALCGFRHIGHSRTAQYGLVNIEKCEFSEVKSTAKLVKVSGEQCATVYADSRLIFLDENGEPCYRPSAADLGFGKDAEIIWQECQIRTFQYAPWNGKRHTYDADRCGIEKGSVFVVKCSNSPSVSQYIGNYNNEGFGKVIYNPDFLQADGNGKAAYTLKESEKDNADKSSCDENIQEKDKTLLQLLRKRKDGEECEDKSYKIVNDFVDANKYMFKGEQFASQWGSIRSLAMINPKPENLIEKIEKFLDHGVAKAKWDERRRGKTLLKFMDDHRGDNLQEIMINLASEMAKKCRKEK